MNSVVSVTALAAASVTVTQVVDAIRNFLSAHLPRLILPKYVWNIVSLAVGIVVCVATKLNLVAGLPIAVHVTAQTGQILTGALFGGGSKFFHELLDMWSGVAKAKHAAAVETVAGGAIVEDPAGGVLMPDGPPGAPAAPPAPPAG